MLYQSIYPNRDVIALNDYLSRHLSRSVLLSENIEQLYNKYSPKNFDLQDQGYITKVHPLELWLVRYLAIHNNASLDDVLKASSQERLAVYRWLFSGHRKHAQQRRIMSLLEEEAFKQIHTAWQKVGYPFDALTPSYATSIGASGDRPAALAELMGVLQNDGVHLPIVRFESLHYAEGTPYEALLVKSKDAGERIFPPEVARAAKTALMGVVNGGTAERVRGVYTDANGQLLAVGGKTGTGDHRKEVWGSGGRLIESKFISRAATFVFFLGDKFFGVITAYVEGDQAENYHFTSALPVQILKHLKPTLSPLITGKANSLSSESPVVVPVSKKPALTPSAPVKPNSTANNTTHKTNIAPVPAAPHLTVTPKTESKLHAPKPAELPKENKTVVPKSASPKPTPPKPKEIPVHKETAPKETKKQENKEVKKDVKPLNEAH